MEVLDEIYHQFFSAQNCFRCQPTTSQFFQPLASQTLAVVAAAILLALAEYAHGKMGMVMFSHDEYQGTFSISPGIYLTLEAIANSS